MFLIFLIAPRSGLAVKNFIDVGAGVIDEDYRGESNLRIENFNKKYIFFYLKVCVLLFNHSEVDF